MGPENYLETKPGEGRGFKIDKIKNSTGIWENSWFSLCPYYVSDFRKKFEQPMSWPAYLHGGNRVSR